MPVTKLPSPDYGMNVEQLVDLMYQYKRELEYLVNGHLDDKNVSAVHADWVYAGGITTDQITAGTALIGAALIETLTVGDNVVMGPDAYISWANVTEQPTIISTADALAAWVASDYATYIDEDGIYTGVLGANDVILANSTSTASLNFDIQGTYYVTLKTAYTTGGNTLLICNTPSIGGTPYNLERMDIYADNVYFYGGIYAAGQQIDFSSATIDFDSATLTNFPGYTHTHDDRYFTETESDLRYATAGHDHGNAYVKTSQNIKIQWFSDHIEVSADGGSTWDVINFV